ncbi:MAG: class I SAM-dependent methyltransferase [Acidobacteria bacterium]|nr:class I SAM-dependent methyltransferase [Acidobacteriota bacterium]
MNKKPPVLTDQGLGEELKKIQMLVQFIEPKPSDLVLDLGTGKGNTAIELAPHVKKIVAVDYEEAVVEDCRKNIREAKLDETITVKKASVNNLDFPDQMFDIITCRAAFHHFPNPLGVLAEVRRILKDDGKFYLMDPIFSDYAKQIWTPIAKIRESDLHSFYTYFEQLDMLSSCGLHVIKFRPFLFKRVLSEWIGNAPEIIQGRLKNVVLNLNERILKELHFRQEEGEWVYFYNVFELIAIKDDLTNSKGV